MERSTLMNTQPAEKAVSHSSGLLEVQGLPFYTIQGEAIFAGRPAVFVRTAGCNLKCTLCDTDYTSQRRLISPHALLAEIRNLRSDGLVVITGGEPFRQELGKFIHMLLCCHYDVQIESNGTLFDESISKNDYEMITVVISPKSGSINKQLMPFVKALKYILRAGYVAKDGLPTDSLGGDCPPCRPWIDFEGEVYVQPADEDDSTLNKKNLQAAIKTCMDIGYYKLSLQQHKILGLA